MLALGSALIYANSNFMRFERMQIIFFIKIVWTEVEGKTRETEPEKRRLSLS